MNLNVAGIYLITNLINKKVYVGKSVNIKQRWQNHKYLVSNCPLLARAIKKYGRDNFSISILQVVDLDRNPFAREELNQLEIEFIKEYHSYVGDPLCNGYNLTTGGDGPEEMSPEARLRAREGMKAYWNKPESRERARQSKLGKGSKWSTEAKERASAARKGIPLPITDECQQRMSVALEAKVNALTQKHWEMIKDFNMSVYGWISQASKLTGLSVSRICTVCKRMGVFSEKSTEVRSRQRLLQLSKYDKMSPGWLTTAMHETGMSYNQIRNICEKNSLPFDSSLKKSESIAFTHWEVLKNYDRSNRGWIKTAMQETRLTRTQIRKTCEKMGVDFRTERTSLKRKGEKESRAELLSRYDKTSPLWVVDAMNDTGLSYQQIIYFCKKNAIACDVSCPEDLRNRKEPDRRAERLRIAQSKIDTIRAKLSLYDNKKRGWLKRASQDLGVSRTTIIKYCKIFGWYAEKSGGIK
jgi:group I intron endonuclease